MAREGFEYLPLWKAAQRLALDAHRVAAQFPADEKSGLGGALKKHADAPAALTAHADAADTPDQALGQLAKCETSFRELLNTALLAQQLDIVSRAELRRFRLHVARLRRLVADEGEAWEDLRDEQERLAKEAQRAEAEAKAESREPVADHAFDPRDQPAIQRELALDLKLDLDDVDDIGLAPPAAASTPAGTNPLRFPTHPRRKPTNPLARWFHSLRRAA